MNNTYAALSYLSTNHLLLLRLLISSSSSWSINDLVEVCHSKNIQLTENEIVIALQQLIQAKQIDQDNRRYFRDRNLIIWQERWLSTKLLHNY